MALSWRHRMKLSRLLLGLSLLAALLGAPFQAVRAAGGEPRQVVEGLHATILTVMKDAAELGYEGRYARLEPVVREGFDLPYIARIAVGRYWKDLDKGQKGELVRTFGRLSVAAYASRFDRFGGESFQSRGEQELKRGRRLVQSALIKSDGSPVHFDYVLHQKNGQWRIINVVVDGVSDLSLTRAEYTATVEKEGFDALLEKLNDKIETYASGASE
jgi:phospholipid transport system substrate-binding protein